MKKFGASNSPKVLIKSVLLHAISHSPKFARPMIATVNDANEENTTIALPENVVPSG